MFAEVLQRFGEHLSTTGRSQQTITAYTQAVTRVLQATDLGDDGWISVTPIDLAEWWRH